MAPGKRLERALVARAFDQHYGTREVAGRVHAGSVHAGPVVRTSITWPGSCGVLRIFRVAGKGALQRGL